MKIDESTPVDQLVRYRKSCGFAGGFFLTLGILTFPIGIPLILVGVHYNKQKKKAAQLADRHFCPTSPATTGSILAQYEHERKRARDEWQHFLDKNEVVREIHTKVVGVTFRNSDGSSRQKALADICPGEAVVFEYFDYHGEPAYSFTCLGKQIGNLPADLARDLYALPDTYTFVGEAYAITGGDDGTNYGCNLLITLYREK